MWEKQVCYLGEKIWGAREFINNGNKTSTIVFNENIFVKNNSILTISVS
jgi:hypothetical protein